MPSKEILRIRNCIHITVTSYFHLQLVFRSVSLQILGLKPVKARNELDGACGLPLVYY